MKHVLACLAFLIGFPLLFAAGELVAEYASWQVGQGRYNPFPRLLEGHFTNGVFVWVVVLVACGIWDMVDMFGGFSDYRAGMRGYLPKHNPLGFVLMRARRYVLVVAVVVAAFVVCYIAPSTRSNISVPHIWFGFGALVIARRPLNTTPFLMLVNALKAVVAGFGEMLEGFARSR